MKRFDKLTRVCQAVAWDLMITQEFVTFQPRITQIKTKQKTEPVPRLGTAKGVQHDEINPDSRHPSHQSQRKSLAHDNQ
ncbi:hypothetical protein RS9916_40176 [Synechococcus sp. RS9916]|nr:hypothetical protein RS9916_40176 [Synechococcus sp. RS9916]